MTAASIKPDFYRREASSWFVPVPGARFPAAPLALRSRSTAGSGVGTEGPGHAQGWGMGRAASKQHLGVVVLLPAPRQSCAPPEQHQPQLSHGDTGLVLFSPHHSACTGLPGKGTTAWQRQKQRCHRFTYISPRTSCAETGAALLDKSGSWD